MSHEIVEGRGVWVQLASGAIEINGTALAVGDGAAIVEESSLTITASEKSEFLLFDLGG